MEKQMKIMVNAFHEIENIGESKEWAILKVSKGHQL